MIVSWSCLTRTDGTWSAGPVESMAKGFVGFVWNKYGPLVMVSPKPYAKYVHAQRCKFLVLTLSEEGWTQGVSTRRHRTVLCHRFGSKSVLAKSIIISANI